MVFKLKYIVPKGFQGITLYPFVFVGNHDFAKDKCFMNHEKIHLRQQLELLVIPFYIIYGIEFLIRLVRYKNWIIAYRAISFEKEAYANETNLEYLKQRGLWRFISYF